MTLPKVCEALVLVTQCVVTLCLEAEEHRARVENGSSTYDEFTNMKDYFNRKKYQENGMVESLIGIASEISG
jgi:ataxin-10